MATKSITAENKNVKLIIDLDENINPCQLVDLKQKVTYADADYSYKMYIKMNEEILESKALKYGSHKQKKTGDGQAIELEGRLDFGPSGPKDIHVRQTFHVPQAGGWIDEEISIINEGKQTYSVEDICFGFRKIIYRRKETAWDQPVEDYSLVPVPHRRRFGHRIDRKVNDYKTPDLLPHMWEDTRVGGPEGENLPDHGSEGWVWTDGKKGLLVLKYAPWTIEFSMFKGGMYVPDFCVRFGGVGIWRGDPEFAMELAAGATNTFGTTHYEMIKGGWKEGYYAFRDYLVAKGMVCPVDYNPPVHWNELYNLSWRLGDGSSRYTLDQLYREAEVAADIGCESLYLDPGWDPIEGATTWDEKYFGISLSDFVKTIKEKYGLEVSLHLMSHTNSKTEYKGMYRKDAQGKIVPCWDGAKVCMQSQWKEEKKRRVLELAKAGVAYFMFDFQEWYPTCYDKTHGHEVPLKRQSHAEGINEVIRAVKKEYPHLYIEAHDRVTTGLQDYHPLYYQYDPPHSFTENWGFEYMWDSYLDLISGKAVSMYEYNLAYEIPLYLHINIGQKSGLLHRGTVSVGPDNENMLAFWWYASTARHLGIGGVNDPGSALYKALKKAMKTYMSLIDFYKRGTFYGIDEMAHVHTQAKKNQAVINLFNLTGKSVKRDISVKTKEIGLKSFKGLNGAELIESGKDQFRFKITLKPLSPALVKINIDV